MIEATPSIAKNTISTKVSDSTPLSGHTSSTMPAAIASTADTSAHQNPGAWRIQKVVIRPMTPLIRKSHEENLDRERGDRRQHDGDEAEHHQDDALDQKHLPMLMQR